MRMKLIFFLLLIFPFTPVLKVNESSPTAVEKDVAIFNEEFSMKKAANFLITELFQNCYLSLSQFKVV